MEISRIKKKALKKVVRPLNNFIKQEKSLQCQICGLKFQ